MEAVVVREGAWGSWLPSFLDLIGGGVNYKNKEGKPAVDRDKLDQVLAVIGQNRMNGSPMPLSAFTIKQYQEVYQCCYWTRGVVEPAFRTNVLATAYMKALADSSNALLTEEEKENYRTKIISADLRCCRAEGLLKVPAIKSWLEGYYFASHRSDLSTMLEKLYAGYPEERVTKLKAEAESRALLLSQSYQNCDIRKDDLKQLVQKIQAKIGSGEDVKLSNRECKYLFDLYAENASKNFRGREKLYWKVEGARLLDFLKAAS